MNKWLTERVKELKGGAGYVRYLPADMPGIEKYVERQALVLAGWVRVGDSGPEAWLRETLPTGREEMEADAMIEETLSEAGRMAQAAGTLTPANMTPSVEKPGLIAKAEHVREFLGSCHKAMSELVEPVPTNRPDENPKSPENLPDRLEFILDECDASVHELFARIREMAARF